MSPHGFSLLQTHSMILEGSLTASCVHLFVHNKLPEKTAVVGLVSLVLLEVVLGALCPCRGPTAEGSAALGGPGHTAAGGRAAESLWPGTGVGEMPLLPLSSAGWGWLCLCTRPGSCWKQLWPQLVRNLFLEIFIFYFLKYLSFE